MCGNSSVTTPSGLSRMAMPATKSLRSGTWARTLLPTIRSAPTPSETSCLASRTPKKSTRVGMPFSTAARATLAAGSMPSTGTPSGREMLQEVAVIARQLDGQAVGAEVQALGDLLAVALGVRHPARREGREIGVLGEDRFRAHILLELHEVAGLADQHVQREVHLHLIDFAGLQEALAGRRHAEVDECVLEPAAAKPAVGGLGLRFGLSAKVNCLNVHS